MREYAIMRFRTNKGLVWEVRKKGRVLWREMGRFATEAEAHGWIEKDTEGYDGGYTLSVCPEVIDRRTGWRLRTIWVLEYSTFRQGKVLKQREEFLTRWNAELHKWILSYDRTVSGLKVWRDSIE